MINLKKAFREGKPDYAPSTMWFFNDALAEDEITFQLEAFKASGTTDCYVHPMYGLRGNYLDDRFMAMIRHTVLEAKRLGMSYWIYDEYNWPSGVAGGYVIRDKPWTRMPVLNMIRRDVAPGACLTEQLPPPSLNTKLLMAFVLDQESASPVEVSIDGENRLFWTNRAGRQQSLLIFYTAWFDRTMPYSQWSEFCWGQKGYLDVLDPEAVAAFIEATHERYKQFIGDWFGTVVRGVFTDEVSATIHPGLPDTCSLNWSRHFAERFQEQHGYDVISVLPELFLDLDPQKTARARTDFWMTVSRLYNDSYMRQTSKWCERHSLIYTGHCLYEETGKGHLLYSGDLFEAMRSFHQPGIDTILSCQKIDNYDYNITGKLVCSIAHHQGKSRVLSETFSISGWDKSLSQMKRIVNRLFILGINGIQYMGAYYSLNGFRKTGPGGGPPSHGWNNPLFRHYPVFNRYLSGLQWLIDQTSCAARALVLYPYATVRAKAGGQSDAASDPALETFDLTAQGLTNALLELQVPFEFGFEQVFEQAEVLDGSIRIGDCTYDVLFLCAATHVTPRSVTVIRRFIEQGGRTVMVNGLPLTETGKMEASGLEDLLEQESVVILETEIYDRTPDKKKAPPGAFAALISRSLEGLEPFVCSIEPDPGILSAYRKSEEDIFVLLVNDSSAEKTVCGRWHHDRSAQFVDPENGTLRRLVRKNEVFEISLAGYETVVLATGQEPAAEEPAECEGKDQAIFRLQDGWRLVPDGLNCYVPAPFRIRDSQDVLAAHFAGAAAGVSRAADRQQDHNLEACVMMLYNAYLPNRGWQPQSGLSPGERQVAALYDFTVGEQLETLELVAEQEYPVAWYLNGQRLSVERIERVWQRDNLILDLSGVAAPGRNRLVAVGIYPDYQAPFGVPCAVLRGDFRVYDDQLSTRPGGSLPTFWNGQGYPYYSGDLTYERVIELDSYRRVRFSLDTNDVAEVLVNGKRAGLRLWQPYVFDLTSLCRSGQNKLQVRITSTYGNLFYRPTPSGLSRSPELVIWQ